MLRKILKTAILLLLIIPIACQAEGPKSVADAFIQTYFVEVDLEGASILSIGAAKEKIDEELKLRSGQDLRAAKQSRRVSYKLKESKILNKDKHIYQYLVEIKNEGIIFSREAMITVTRSVGKWKVSFFRLFEPTITR